MTKMLSFDVSLNQLSGTLPPEFDQWKRLVAFAVFLNPLTGVLPPSYGPAWVNVTSVLIYRTHIGGPIPDSWGAMKNMLQLQLFNNQLNGTLPASLGNYSSLYFINLSFNNFSGPVPWAAWLAWRNVVVIGLQDNPYLSGVVPDTWGSVLQLSSLFAVCRTGICGPQLPQLILGYGCAPSSFIKQLTVIDSESMTAMMTTSAYQPSVPCPTRQPAAAPRNRTRTIPIVSLPNRMTQSPSVAVSRSIVTASASVIIVAQAVSAGSGALHVMQASQVIQKLRLRCAAALADTADDDETEHGHDGHDSLSHGDRSSSSSEDVLCCDVGTSPMQFHIDLAGGGGNFNSDMASVAGAVVGNTVIVIVYWMLRLAGHVWLLPKPKRRSEVGRRGMFFDMSDVMQASSPTATFPPAAIPLKEVPVPRWTAAWRTLVSLCCSASGLSALWPAYTFLLCPVAEVVVALVFMSSSGHDNTTSETYGILLASCVAVVWCIPLVVANGAILWNNPSLAAARLPFRFRCGSSRAAPPHHSGDGEGRRPQACLAKCKLYFLEPREEIVVASGAVARKLMHRYGAVFSGYRASRLWYFNVEAAFAIATGVLCGVAIGLASSDPCSAVAIARALVGVGALELLVACVIRPFSARIDLILLLVLGGLSLVSQVVTLVWATSAAQVTSAVIGFVATCFQLLAGILLAIDVVASGKTTLLRVGVVSHRPLRLSTAADPLKHFTVRRATPVKGAPALPQHLSNLAALVEVICLTKPQGKSIGDDISR